MEIPNVVSRGTAIAFVLAIANLVCGPAAGALSMADGESEGLFGWYDTFVDNQCRTEFVTVWSKKEVNRLGNAGTINSYREFFTCHVWASPGLS